MKEHLRYLSQHCPVPISVLPNAGLPSVVDGRTHYDLTPERAGRASTAASWPSWASASSAAAAAPRPAHLAAVVEAVTRPRAGPRARRSRAERHVDLRPGDASSRTLASSSSASAPTPTARGPSATPCWPATGTPARGWPPSRSARAPTCSTCASTTSGRDGAADMDEIARRFATQASVPLVLDSTEPPVLEAALQHIGGRAILNSANLEDGELPGSRHGPGVLPGPRVRRAVICLLIDERGQARDVEWKMEIAHRIHQIATRALRAVGRATSSSTPSPSRCRPATTTCAATPWTRSRPSGASRPRSPARSPRSACPTSASASSPAARHVLNSVFLHECVQAGLDSAIVHAGKIMPLNKIPDEQRDVCLDLDLRPPRPATTAALRPAAAAARGVRRRQERQGRQGGPHRLAGRGAAQAPHHRRRPRRPRPTTSTRRSPRASPRWTSSTTCCSTACGWWASCSAPARCSCRSCCSRPRP